MTISDDCRALSELTTEVLLTFCSAQQASINNRLSIYAAVLLDDARKALFAAGITLSGNQTNNGSSVDLASVEHLCRSD